MVNVDKIKALAKERGISVTYLCQQFGMGRGYLNDVAKTSGKMPDDRIRKIADTLGTSYEYLTDQTDDPTPPTINKDALNSQEEAVVKHMVEVLREVDENQREILVDVLLLPADEITQVLQGVKMIMGNKRCGCALTACSGNNGNNSEEEKGAAPDLTGSWIETNTDSDTKMSAEITSDTIEVYWSSDETRALYWSGTYAASTEAGTYTWSSVNDHDKTDSALLASSDDTKDFTYNSDGEITFDVTAMGVTKTVHLAKE